MALFGHHGVFFFLTDPYIAVQIYMNWILYSPYDHLTFISMFLNNSDGVILVKGLSTSNYQLTCSIKFVKKKILI